MSDAFIGPDEVQDRIMAGAKADLLRAAGEGGERCGLRQPQRECDAMFQPRKVEACCAALYRCPALLSLWTPTVFSPICGPIEVQT